MNKRNLVKCPHCLMMVADPEIDRLEAENATLRKRLAKLDSKRLNDIDRPLQGLGGVVVWDTNISDEQEGGINEQSG